MEKLPYTADYAKSSRSSCKGCRMGIGKDSLRIGVMVQSPHFDGMIPNWHHLQCFFRKNRPKATADIEKFDQLRWEDQKSIKTSIEGGGSAGGGNGDANGGGVEKSLCTVEYAKSARSKCRSCEEKIEKEVLRLAVKDFDSDSAKRFGPVDRWYHIPCFEKEKDDLDLPEDFDVTKVLGFNTLRDEDRDDLKKRFKVSAGKKRKPKEEAAPAAKKAKVETAEEKAQKEQSELLWKIRDKLNQEVASNALKGLLEYNRQQVPRGGESILQDRVSDIMAFGRLKPCPECQGQLMYTALAYKCTGQVTEWTSCLYQTREPRRGKFKVPKEYHDVEFLKNFKFKKRERLFPYDEQTAASMSQPSIASSSAAQKIPSDKPLTGMLFHVLKASYPSGASKAELEEKLKDLGAKIVASVNAKVAAVIGTQALVDKCAQKQVVNAKSADVHVVKEDFVTEVAKGGAALLIQSLGISPWGSDPLGRIGEPSSKSGAVVKKGKSDESRFKAELSKVKMKVKGGAAVDPDSGLEDSAHVLKAKDGEPLNAVLGMVDLVRGSNSYYKLQVLEADHGKRWYVFRAWGRIGTTIGGNKLEKYHSALDAIEQFRCLYLDKTGNTWENRKDGKQVNKFFPLEMDYGEDDESVGKMDLSSSKSALPKNVQSLIQFVFDIESMKQTMLEFEIDLKKMPLGKLSRNQIEKAYSVLTELNKLVVEGGTTSRVLDASTRFYALIPHDFGMQKPPMLDTADVIKGKIEMLDSLLEIEIAYSLMKAGGGEEPVDAYYKKLNAKIEPLDKESEEYQRLVDYVANTHAATHRQYKLEVEDIFKIQREGEAARYRPFKKMPNRRLLWHGSRRPNWAGILSQGLRIAPPEAPATGYMFGKGIYFADMVSKSANYCFTNPANPKGLMLLCEVALGTMAERTSSDSYIKLQPDEHSCWGKGRTFPDPSGTYTSPDGVVYPMGSQMQQPDLHTSLLYNEFIVYDVAQVEQRYLFRMNFNYGR